MSRDSPDDNGNNNRDRTNWDPFVGQSSALGILRPNIVFDAFASSNSTTTSSPTIMTSHQLPHARLVRTTHAEDGTSVFASDDLVAPFFPFDPTGTSFSVFDRRDAVPVADITAPVAQHALANTLPRCPPAGVIFCISDFPPGRSAPMHRTASLDYIVVLAGEVVLRLDGGDEKTVRAGELIVQQGVNHEWHNRGQVPCRFLCVMVASDKVTLKDGTELEETVFKKQ